MEMIVLILSSEYESERGKRERVTEIGEKKTSDMGRRPNTKVKWIYLNSGRGSPDDQTVNKRTWT